MSAQILDWKVKIFLKNSKSFQNITKYIQEYLDKKLKKSIFKGSEIDCDREVAEIVSQELDNANNGVSKIKNPICACINEPKKYLN